mmetsp:Transcript_105147/g.279844  ORF Transcript_105147/g.279844 Transcript_105147/m.279844 type:complete len:206 (+) Transcript_105147:960-1577(+)
MRGLWRDNLLLEAERLHPLSALTQGAPGWLAIACGTRRGQVLRQSDVATAAWPLQWHDNIAVALQAHRTDVAEAGILQELREFGVPESRLAELGVEPRTEEPLHVGEGNRVYAWCKGAEDLLQASTHHLPGGKSPLALCGTGARPLALGAPLLHHRLRALVRYHCTVEVAEQLLLGDRELHNVANFAQRAANKKLKATCCQHLCT